LLIYDNENEVLLNNVKNMISYIQILSTINYFITFIILLIK
jgi:hypothetical protein